jgi:ABC-type molybdate transport system permease subunit
VIASIAFKLIGLYLLFVLTLCVLPVSVVTVPLMVLMVRKAITQYRAHRIHERLVRERVEMAQFASRYKGWG